MSARISTGDGNLDEILCGGFPKGSLIVIAGNPGVGKSIFSAQFIYRGIISESENGVYVSFAENRETFMTNMRGLGFAFEKLEAEGRFKFLDMIALKETGIPTVLESILKEIRSVNAKRLVIDSFSAMAQAFKEPIEARIVIHTVLGNIVRQMGCTSLIIAEVPINKPIIGFGMEEFVADGVIILRSLEFEGRLLRELEIIKMRGTPIKERKLLFTLKEGFRAFTPFKLKTLKGFRRFQPIPDPPEKFSTGSEDLDDLLGGGYRRGSVVLLEIGENVSYNEYHLIVAPTAWNFLTQGRGVTVFPSLGIDSEIVKRVTLRGGITEDEMARLVRVCELRFPGSHEPSPSYIVSFKGKNLVIDYAKYVETEEEIIRRTGKPILRIMSAETLMSISDSFGGTTSSKIYLLDSLRIRKLNNLSIILLKPGSEPFNKAIAAAAETHLKVVRKHGTLLLYGMKPSTKIHALEMNVSEGYPKPKLTPIM